MCPPKPILQFPKQLHKKKESIKWEQSSLSWSPLRRLRCWFLKCYSSIHKSTSQQPHNAAILKQNVGNISHIKGLQFGSPGFDPWFGKIPWRRKQQPTPILLTSEHHGQRNLVGYSLWGCKALDTTEQLTVPLSSEIKDW